MPNSVIFKTKIKPFKKKITVSGDKSLSIRWVLFSSLAKGVSEAENLLLSEDVIAAINAVKKLGIDPLDMASILPDYLWRYRPSGQYDAIKDSAKNLRS